MWRKKGQRLVVTVQHRSTWIYLYGFVCPQTGENFWLLLPTVTIAVWNSALAECATAVGAGPTKRVILVIDQAGWHTSAKATIPDGLHLVWLPPYAPELQPAERLWTLSDEAVANEHFHDVDALVAPQAERCRTLTTLPEVVQA